MQQIDIDYESARLEAERGIARAAEHAGDDWMAAAVKDFAAFVRERGTATCEQWRFDWLSRGRPGPSTHKAYGAVASTAARRGLVVHTGRYIRASSVKTHAHPVPLWSAA